LWASFRQNHDRASPHGRDLRDHGLLLPVVVDVVAGGEERRHVLLILPAAVVHRRERGRHDPPEEEPSPPFAYRASFPGGVNPQLIYRWALAHALRTVPFAPRRLRA
jgi:hypothetical protein